MKTTIAFLALVGATTLVGQIRTGAATPISKTDPIFKSLADHQAAWNARDEERKETRAVFADWVEVKTPAGEKLFPGLRFASIAWSLALHPESKTGEASRAAGLEQTLAVNPTSGRVEAVLSINGTATEFGKLLNAHSARLRDAAEAKAIWEAFCEIHHFHGKDLPAKKVSAAEWHLGISSSDQTKSVADGFKTVETLTYYTKVMADPASGKVLSWERKADSSKLRKVPAN